MSENQKFEYNYSASKQEEIEKIRKKYLPREETKIDKLHRLDKSVTRSGTIISIIVGILGTLIMGFGMCLCLEWSNFLGGIIVGIIGIIILAFAYPIYSKLVKKKKEKIAPEILKLTDEILQENYKS